MGILALSEAAYPTYPKGNLMKSIQQLIFQGNVSRREAWNFIVGFVADLAPKRNDPYGFVRRQFELRVPWENTLIDHYDARQMPLPEDKPFRLDIMSGGQCVFSVYFDQDIQVWGWRAEDGTLYQQMRERIQWEFTSQDVKAPRNPNSGKFAYDYEKRREIVQQYWEARQRGQITNKDAWANTHHDISGKTLDNYIREFPEITNPSEGNERKSN